ncbi:MAG: 50S ribosomal protein L11 methyltransferase [Rubrivivax sp.]|jgi:ribosomal protein L11 methyltransferase|nr:50S ribosomal protein L11 methyltransferase [Rubrivivax sp.]
MSHVELVLRVPESLVESLSDALIDEAEALSVSVEDADAGSQDERPLFGEPGMPVHRSGWERSTLRVLFESEAQATEAATLLQAQAWASQVHLQALQVVPDTDWVRLTQSQFAPVPITTSFWIVPTWHEVPAAARQVIRLDPGLAFGTGTHPTTRMCLRWIAAQAERSGGPLGWERVLDYGCGSGILAVAAGLFGARGIDAVDIDPAAVASTQANAAANGVGLQAGLPDAAAGLYPVVLANILATPLKLLAPLLRGHLAPGGQLVLAGILERQAGELTQAYAPYLALQVTDAEEGWVLMTGSVPLR